jgi:hypothetical protein
MLHQAAILGEFGVHQKIQSDFSETKHASFKILLQIT